MKKNYARGNKGFIKAIVVVGIALVLLYVIFDFNILKIFSDPRVKPYADKVITTGLFVWNEYLEPIVQFIVRHSTTLALFVWKYIVIAGAWLKDRLLDFYPEFLRFW